MIGPLAAIIADYASEEDRVLFELDINTFAYFLEVNEPHNCPPPLRHQIYCCRLLFSLRT